MYKGSHRSIELASSSTIDSASSVPYMGHSVKQNEDLSPAIGIQEMTSSLCLAGGPASTPEQEPVNTKTISITIAIKLFC